MELGRRDRKFVDRKKMAGWHKTNRYKKLAPDNKKKTETETPEGALCLDVDHRELLKKKRKTIFIKK